jgi:hypothetical protein
VNVPGSVAVMLRIPGRWGRPRELVAAMPEGYKLTPETVGLPDGTSIELGFRKADDRFAEVFRSACRRPPLGDGHLIGDETGPRFQTVAQVADLELADSVMGNPVGRLKLVSMKDIAEAN